MVPLGVCTTWVHITSIHTNYQWKLYLHYIVEKVRPIKLRLYYGKIPAKINAELVPILSFIENESSA